jgi:hypothetical protein
VYVERDDPAKLKSEVDRLRRESEEERAKAKSKEEEVEELRAELRRLKAEAAQKAQEAVDWCLERGLTVPTPLLSPSESPDSDAQNKQHNEATGNQDVFDDWSRWPE